MNSFDDIFETAEKSDKKETKPFDKASWIEQKQAEKDTAYSLMAEMAEKMGTDGDAFKQYLDVQSRFNRYSVGNALLVVAQQPDATRLADFDTWKQNGAYVKKGESGIILLEPGEEYTRDDGTTGVSFNTKKLFDISQTSFDENQKSTVKRDERQIIKAIMADSPCKIAISADISERTGAEYDDKSGTILVRRGMSGADIIKCLSREIASVRMADAPSHSNIGFNAYCVSYMVCKRYGVDAANFDFSKLPSSIQNKSSKDIRKELSQIRETANDMFTEIDKAFERQKTDHSRDDVR